MHIFAQKIRSGLRYLSETVGHLGETLSHQSDKLLSFKHENYKQVPLHKSQMNIGKVSSFFHQDFR